MKKILIGLSTLLLLIALFVGMSISTSADDTIHSGTWGSNLSWTFNATTGELTISGTGSMNALNSSYSAWRQYSSQITSVTINSGVTSIGNNAFYGCSSLTSVTIPDSVTSIGYNAFRSCTSLTNVTIPDSVTSIGSDAFYNCSNLEDVYITDVEAWLNISFDGIYACPNYYGKLHILGEDGTEITELIIPNGVTSIRNYAFLNCTSLTSVTIGDSVTSIGSSAFYGCNRLLEIVNNSNLELTTGSSSHGYVAYYAMEVHDGESKIFNVDDYLFYSCGNVNY